MPSSPVRSNAAASRHQKLQQCFHFSCGRCQDRAKLKLEAELTHMPLAELACKQLTPTRLIYPREDYEQDKGGKRDSLSRKQFFAYLVHESRGTYQQYEPSPCKQITQHGASVSSVWNLLSPHGHINQKQLW